MCYQETWLHSCHHTKIVLERIHCALHIRTRGGECEGFIGYVETVGYRCPACEAKRLSKGLVMPAIQRLKESVGLGVDDLHPSRKWIWSARENGRVVLGVSE